MPDRLDRPVRHRFGAWTGAIVGATAALLAVQSFRAALAWSAGPGNKRALQIAIADGLLREKAARVAYIADARMESATLPDKPSPEAVSYARDAFRSEPLASDAVVLLGIDAAARNELGKARKLVEGAAQLSKRNSLASIWLIEDLASRNDIDAVLVQYDKLLRTNVATRAALFGPMMLAMEDASFVVSMGKLLASGPPWADDFWAAVVAAPKAVANGGALRARLRGTMQYDHQRDDPLFEALVRAGHYEEAERLYAAIVPAGTTPAGELVKNATFARVPMGGPIDWLIYSAGDFGASIDRSAGTLAISSIDRGGGTVARQLLDLAPGRYRIATTVDFNEGVPDSPVLLSLSCQRGQGSSNFRWPLHKGGNRRDFFVSADCRYFFIDVVVAPSAETGGVDATLTGISIKRR